MNVTGETVLLRNKRGSVLMGKNGRKVLFSHKIGGKGWKGLVLFGTQDKCMGSCFGTQIAVMRRA